MDILNVILYLAIAISGTVFGSFFTLAVHRIPKHQDITHERSYCPNCNHKLQFPDLIPVFSYIFLGGKCRYCGNKIRPRYLILEICSGLSFVLMALFRHITVETPITGFIDFAIDILFLCAIFIIAGIDKEYKRIPNSLILYGCCVILIKFFFGSFYLEDVISNNTFVDALISIFIYCFKVLFIPIVFYLINYICNSLLKLEKLPFGSGDIKYLAILGLYFGLGPELIGIAISSLCILVWCIIKKFKDISEIPWGFFLSIAFTILMAVQPIMTEVFTI